MVKQDFQISILLPNGTVDAIYLVQKYPKSSKVIRVEWFYTAPCTIVLKTRSGLAVEIWSI